MKKVLIATGVAFLALATIASAQGYTFNANLTVGSTGADVVALQTWLMANGYNIPAIASGAAAKGYFGSQTKSAVTAYQASKGIPNTGFVGPLTRGALNAGGGAASVGVTTCPAGYDCIPKTSTPVAVVCPVGYDCVPKAGTTGTVITSAGITTIGAEGLITTKLASSPIADSNIRIASDVPVYGIEVKAQGSDMRVDRVLLQMAVGVGSATASLSNPATFVRKLYAYDGSTLIKSWDLGAADFNKDSSDRYYVIAAGMNFVIPKDATKVITFKVDTVGVSSDQNSRYLTVQGYAGNTQNVRAVDGAGMNTYTDMSGTSNSRVQIFATSGSSTLTTTLDSGLTPKANTNRVTSDGVKLLTMQIFNIKSETGDSTIKSMYVQAGATSTAGLPSTLYLYDGTTMLASVSASATNNAQVQFTDLTIKVPKDTIKTLTIKADFASTVGGQAASTSIPTNGIKWEKPDSTTASTSPTSALTSNDQYLYAAAPQWTLVSSSISKVQGDNTSASSTITGTIKLKATAFGGAMTKPVVGDFRFGFASTTASSYTNFNNIIPLSDTSSSTAKISVDPTDATVGDGGSYTVTLTGSLTTLSTSVGTGLNSFRMVVADIDSLVGGNTISNQTWAIDTFYTEPESISKAAQF